VRIYVDSSVVLRHILDDDPTLRSVASADSVGSSDLLIIECQRVLQRERMAGHREDGQYAEVVSLQGSMPDRLSILESGEAVKRRAAGPFPTVVGTREAIDLASALLWQAADPGSEIRLLTHDRQLALCARALGLQPMQDPGRSFRSIASPARTGGDASGCALDRLSAAKAAASRKGKACQSA
jgi:predicted nucleic acid-binding protein